MSAKVTPEICIYNASSNSRLTAAGRQATAADTILRTASRLFIFFSLSPYLLWENNQITPASWKTYWNCIAFEHGTLGGVFFVRICVVLFYFMHPLWWDDYRTISEAPSPGLETEISLHLNLEVFWFFWVFLNFLIFHFILIHFYK
jgi:hypothetical protein